MIELPVLPVWINPVLLVVTIIVKIIFAIKYKDWLVASLTLPLLYALIVTTEILTTGVRPPRAETMLLNILVITVLLIDRVFALFIEKARRK